MTVPGLWCVWFFGVFFCVLNAKNMLDITVIFLSSVSSVLCFLQLPDDVM